MRKKRNICVDMDRVLMRYDGYTTPEDIGPVLPGAREFLRELKALGLRVVLHTTRATSDVNMVEIIRTHLEDNRIDLLVDEIYVGVGKPPAIAYVDDRAVFCDPQEDGLEAFRFALEQVKYLQKRSYYEKSGMQRMWKLIRKDKQAHERTVGNFNQKR